MIRTNVRMAVTSIRSARVRSFLTMLGVIIGVTSVVMIVSLGEGVKNQVVSQINQLGNDIITIRPGRLFTNQSAGDLAHLNISPSVGASSLTEQDVNLIMKQPNIAAVSYNASITGLATSSDNPNYPGSTILATTPKTKDVLGFKLEFGEFFNDQSGNSNTTVIGSNIAADLFNQRDPIGRTITIRGQNFTVRGVIEPLVEAPLNIGLNINNAVYIPIEAGKKLSGGSLQISEIDAKVASGQKASIISDDIKMMLIKNHSGQEDFTIVKQQEYLKVANQVFNILTTFVATIAGISLLVGGIGIMNIMLVSVSERTREIGVRKAVGATNRQILSQFLVESTMISILGGIIGILIALGASFIVRITTTIHPSISLTTILIALGVSTCVGVIFGTAPAIQAARKDPIEALRHE